MVGYWITVAILVIVITLGILSDRKKPLNEMFEECLDEQTNEAENINIPEISKQQSNENYFVAITATIVFPFTGLPHLLLLLCANNEKTKTAIDILETINIIILSIVLLFVVGFLILFGTCFVALAGRGHF